MRVEVPFRMYQLIKIVGCRIGSCQRLTRLSHHLIGISRDSRGGSKSTKHWIGFRPRYHLIMLRSSIASKIYSKRGSTMFASRSTQMCCIRNYWPLLMRVSSFIKCLLSSDSKIFSRKMSPQFRGFWCFRYLVIWEVIMDSGSRTLKRLPLKMRQRIATTFSMTLWRICKACICITCIGISLERESNVSTVLTASLTSTSSRPTSSREWCRSSNSSIRSTSRIVSRLTSKSTTRDLGTSSKLC